MTAGAEILPPIGAVGPKAPIAEPVLVHSDGFSAFVPHPSGKHEIVPIRSGIHMGWAPLLVHEQILLVLFTGETADIGFASTLSRAGLQALIADLQSIDEQLGDAK